jgi:hypothetical protein
MRAVLLCVAVARLAVNADSLDLKERPVSKVINLLKEMQVNLEKEKAADEELYEKLNCWCETNEKEKTGAVEEAQRRITALVADIEKHSGKSAQLTAEIAQLEKEIAANKAALETATSVREKEHADFNQNEKDMVQAIESLKNAVLVLSKHHSFLQMPKNAFVEVHESVARLLLNQAIKPAQRKALAAIQQPAGAGQSYAPQSGQIYGILNQMKEEFENNLSDSQKAEMQAAEEFAALKAAKTKEIETATTQVKQKKQSVADTDDALATAKEDLELTREALASDRTFLSDLNLRCQQTDKDWELRSKVRAEEIAAVSETIKILNDDDAHDNFSKTLNFVQKTVDVRAKAAAVLRSAAAKGHSTMLLALASSVQLDAFTKVKKAIDDMVDGLKAEQADEVKHRDFCTDELNENESNRARKKREIEELTSLIETSAANIDQLAKDIAALQAANVEMQKQMEQASQDRELENKDFQQAVTEQRQTQAILKKALARMQEFYKEKDAAFAQITQEPGAAVAPMPEGFKEYKKSGGASGVVQLLQNIIDEAHQMEKDSLQSETDSQASYEEFIKNSNASIDANNKSIVAKTESKAETEAQKVQAEGDKVAANDDAEKLQAYNAELHGSCDFILKNFDLRQNARSEEIEALQQAKSILSGASLD